MSVIATIDYPLLERGARRGLTLKALDRNLASARHFILVALASLHGEELRRTLAVGNCEGDSLEWRYWILAVAGSIQNEAFLKRRLDKAEMDAGANSSEAAASELGLPTSPANDKYQKILDAAVEVIAENGYFNAPISAIAARAGVADGTVYLYFKSKDEVLRTAIDRNFDRFHQRVIERFKDLHDPREQLEYIAETHLEGGSANRAMAIVMQTEVRQSAKFIAEFSHHHLVKYIQVVREIIRRGQQQGIFRQDISDGVVAHCMFGAIDELLSSAVFTGRVYDAKATAKQVLDVLLNGITGSGNRE